MTLLLITTLLILLPVFGESIPDYDDPYSPIFVDKPIYSWTDKIKITIIAPSWNTDRHLIDSIGDDEDNPIKISTGENSLKPYRFTETDVNSGIFTAEIILTGFLHDADGDGDIDTVPRTTGNGPTSGFLEVDRDSGVTVSFEFADGLVLTESIPISWNLGTIQFLKDVFSSDDSVIIRIIDPDMNLNPEALDHVPIELSSDSDVAGIIVDAIETSESSGSFLVTISLSQTLPSSGNRLYANIGDEISAKYDDNTLPKPFSISDNLEIEAFAKIDSSILSINRLENLPIFLSDSFGNKLESFSSHDQIQIVGTITNEQDFKQKFVYLFQVKDDTGSVESLSWIQAELSPKQSLGLSQSWIPKKSGTYDIETFIWDSLSNPIALAHQVSTLVNVK